MKDRKLRKALLDLRLVGETEVYNAFFKRSKFTAGWQIPSLVNEQNETLAKLHAVREQIDALMDYFIVEFEVMPTKLKVVPRRTA